MVTRTDFIHKKNIFHHLNDNPLQQNQFKIFKKKLLIGNMMSIDPSSQEVPNTFRLSDWFQVGLREDIENWGRIKNTISNMDLSNSGCTEKIWMTAVLKKNNYKRTRKYDLIYYNRNHPTKQTDKSKDLIAALSKKFVVCVVGDYYQNKNVLNFLYILLIFLHQRQMILHFYQLFYKEFLQYIIC